MQKAKMNYRVILDAHNTKIKSAPSHPLHLKFMYLYHLGGASPAPPHTHTKKLSSSASRANCDQPWAARGLGGLGSRGLYPSPHHTSSCFLFSPSVFVSHRKMFLPLGHNQRGKCPSLALSSGEKGGLGNSSRSKAAWLYSTIRKWPQEPPFPSETESLKGWGEVRKWGLLLP